MREVETIARHLEISLGELIHRANLSLAKLANRRIEGENIPGLEGNIAQAEAHLDELNNRLEGRRAELAMERHLTIGDIDHIGSAWVLPHPERASPRIAPMVRDDEIESGLIWAVPEGADSLRDDARKVLAWEDIADEETELRLDESQQRQLAESLKRARRDIKETVWRTYKNVMLLGKDGEWKTVDLGLVHSSAAPSIGQLIVERLVQASDIEDKGVSPNFLVRNWPPAFKEWNTRSVRDAFFASPQFPRLLHPDSIKDTIARGVENGMLGYVGKKADGSYAPFHWNSSLSPHDVEVSDDMFLIQRELAEGYKAGPVGTTPGVGGTTVTSGSSTTAASPTTDDKPPMPATIRHLVWNGDVPHQKWMNFYTKVLSKFAATTGLKLTLQVEVTPSEGISPQKVEETKVALRELGLKDSLESE
jgi:hypothetical protein